MDRLPRKFLLDETPIEMQDSKSMEVLALLVQCLQTYHPQNSVRCELQVQNIIPRNLESLPIKRRVIHASLRSADYSETTLPAVDLV